MSLRRGGGGGYTSGSKSMSSYVLAIFVFI